MLPPWQDISKTAVLLREEDDFINSLAEEKLKEIILSAKENEVSLDVQKFIKEHNVIKRRILRRAVMSIKPDIKDISQY